jgi:HSP20 family molecular chaperone IbpA
MLLNFDPFQTFDRLSRELFSYPTGGGAGWMPMDAWRRGDVVEVAFDLPGIDPASVDLTVERNVLTIRPSGAGSPRRACSSSSASGPRAPSPVRSFSPTRSTSTRSRPGTRTGCCS